MPSIATGDQALVLPVPRLGAASPEIYCCRHSKDIGDGAADFRIHVNVAKPSTAILSDVTTIIDAEPMREQQKHITRWRVFAAADCGRRTSAKLDLGPADGGRCRPRSSWSPAHDLPALQLTGVLDEEQRRAVQRLARGKSCVRLEDEERWVGRPCTANLPTARPGHGIAIPRAHGRLMKIEKRSRLPVRVHGHMQGCITHAYQLRNADGDACRSCSSVSTETLSALPLFGCAGRHRIFAGTLLRRPKVCAEEA